jgi:glutamine synthetase
MNVDQLRKAVADGAVDTVLLVFCDMQGRLQGKRLVGRHFVDDVIEHAAEGCNYLLAVDVDMNTVSGYAMSSWESGYGDFVLKPDFATLRPVPWHERTALCMADLEWHDGSVVVASPRQILRRQLARLAERGWTAVAATELEFIVFRDTYEQAWRKAYRDLEPANYYNVDYSMLGTARVEPLLGRIRRDMAGAGLRVENSKGECNFGQHEINFTYEHALAAADTHTIYKNAAKEIASQEGMAITYMAKFDEREGNSCHIHLSLRKEDGGALFDDRAVFERFVAGQLACLRELTLFLAPNVNSYKRYAVGSFAPTAVAWGHDNRTCSLRVVGHGPSLRVENRVPGGDVNPYLALAAMIASGLHGIDAELELEPPFEGNAYTADKPRVPSTLLQARELFAGSDVAREAFGEDVVAHYLNYADVELRAFEAAVTDWERFRGFERL